MRRLPYFFTKKNSQLVNRKNQSSIYNLLGSLKVSLRKFSKSFLLLAIFWTVLGGCSFSKHLNKERLELYQKNLNVVYKVVHPSFDKSQLLLQTHASTYRLIVKAYSDASRKELIYEETLAINEGNDKVKSFDLKIKRTTYVLELVLTNLGTNEVFKDIQYVDKKRDNDQTILPYLKNGNPLVKNYITKGSELKIKHTDPKITTFYVRYYKDRFKPARAPHIRASRTFSPLQGNSTIKKVEREELFTFSAPGLYFIQVDTLSKLGRFINCFDDDYPQLTDINELIESTRYITKNVEYETLNKSNEQKMALDKFWLERGETKQRSRELIKNYYNRVQSSNLFFTTFKEGWKTDRGLIYIIFGEPDRVQKSYNQEYWYYSSTSRRDATEFFFIKKNGQYIMNRSPFMEYNWKAQIYEWRKGLVRN